jgi:hypothetical protein
VIEDMSSEAGCVLLRRLETEKAGGLSRLRRRIETAAEGQESSRPLDEAISCLELSADRRLIRVKSLVLSQNPLHRRLDRLGLEGRRLGQSHPADSANETIAASGVDSDVPRLSRNRVIRVLTIRPKIRNRGLTFGPMARDLSQLLFD